MTMKWFRKLLPGEREREREREKERERERENLHFVEGAPGRLQPTAGCPHGVIRNILRFDVPYYIHAVHTLWPAFGATRYLLGIGRSAERERGKNKSTEIRLHSHYW